MLNFAGQEYGAGYDSEYGRSGGRRRGGVLSSVLSSGMGGLSGGVIPGGMVGGVGPFGGAGIMPGAMGVAGMPGTGLGGVNVVKSVSTLTGGAPLGSGLLVNNQVSVSYCADGTVGMRSCSGDYQCGQTQYCYLSAGIISTGTCCIRQQQVIGKMLN